LELQFILIHFRNNLFLLICVAREKGEKIRKKTEPNLQTGMQSVLGM